MSIHRLPSPGRRAACLALAALATAGLAPATAQEAYPSRPIKLIVPFARSRTSRR
ncbi:hypothetical protein [Aquincola sp. J276]|uniref:hypothetical protein n=1 Tax=Aquincola sp. J276 TaxID=2898432 RepID=UPI0038573C13